MGLVLHYIFFILSVNPKRIKQIVNDLKDERFLILISLLAIILGLLNVLFHNVWEANVSIVITLFGWFSLIKGGVLFAYPKHIIPWFENITVRFIQVMYVLLFLLGVFLLNEAYGIVPF